MNTTCRQPALNDDEVAAILGVLTNYPVRDCALVLSALSTAGRITSLLAINCGDVWANGDIRRQVVLARANQKGGRGEFRRSVTSRVIPLCDDLRVAIRELLFEQFGSQPPPARQPLFVSREGTRLSRRQATTRLKQIMVRAGVTDRPGFGWHSCRRWWAIKAYSAAVTGHDLLATSRALGHARLTTTALYLGRDEDAVRAAFVGVAAALPPATHLTDEVQPLRAAQ